MSEIEARYPCPVCLGIKMEKMRFGNQASPTLDVCQRCGGIWFDEGELQQLRRLRLKDLSSQLPVNEDSFKMPCHNCRSLMDRNDSKCSNCGWKNILDCPNCSNPMVASEDRGFRLDFCKNCKGVWFDNHELAEIWNGRLEKIAARHQRSGTDIAGDFAGIEMAALFVDLLHFNPGLLRDGARMIDGVGTSVLGGASEVFSNAPELAGQVLEGGSELAGSFFEAIAEIISGIFSALD